MPTHIASHTIMSLPLEDEKSVPPPSYSSLALDSSPPQVYDVKKLPPVFSDLSSSSSPPAYEAPTTYTIGSNINVPRLVPIDYLRTHLRLLKAFRELRDKIERSVAGEDVDDTRIVFEGENATSVEAVVKKMDGTTKWTWIVGLAVERCIVNIILFRSRSPRYDNFCSGLSVGSRQCAPSTPT